MHSLGVRPPRPRIEWLTVRTLNLTDIASVYNYNVQCAECGEIDTPSRPNHWLKWIAGMALVFGGIGFIIGCVAGVATAGIGFVASVFTVPIGLYIGYKVGSIGAELLDGPSCPQCGSTHDTGGLLPF